MYENILRGIFQEHGIHDERTQVDYLRSLQGPMRNLWQSYRNSNIRTEYHCVHTQSAYLLRYYLPYAYLLPYALSRNNQIVENLRNMQQLNVCMIGCGPAPELFGLLEFLSYIQSQIASVRACLADAALGSWSFAGGITLNHLIPRIWDNKSLALNYVSESIFSKDTMSRLCLDAPCMLILQNCLNELATQSEHKTLAVVQELISRLPQGSVVVIIDRQNYDRVDRILGEVFYWASSSNSMQVIHGVTDFAGDYDCDYLRSLVPTVLRRNLLCLNDEYWPTNMDQDGLIMANSVKHISLGIFVSG